MGQKCGDAQRSVEMRDEESIREGELNLTAEQPELNTSAENITFNHNLNISKCSRSTTPIAQTGAILPALAR